MSLGCQPSSITLSMLDSSDVQPVSPVCCRTGFFDPSLLFVPIVSWDKAYLYEYFTLI